MQQRLVDASADLPGREKPSSSNCRVATTPCCRAASVGELVRHLMNRTRPYARVRFITHRMGRPGVTGSTTAVRTSTATFARPRRDNERERRGRRARARRGPVRGGASQPPPAQPRRGAGSANSSAASTSWGSAIPVGSAGSDTGPWCSAGSGAGTPNSSAASTSWGVVAVQRRIGRRHPELLRRQHVVRRLVGRGWARCPLRRSVPDRRRGVGRTRASGTDTRAPLIISVVGTEISAAHAVPVVSFCLPW